ncbi:MFS transporter [Micromonospora auratinigra]|uniref:MFS-type transporter involved in bile tolerance, Atg22 family n=1 Tax=Micromonospora auratinigra TaxID=261654 RepID=A0A1A9A1C3_9ACTN|nr:MFS transporter [Micromonospora auratinigra]SBT49883.1 MFS-type transporter involved in bile tolerance, Atg22 family [Micromonospora auratinigra]
MTVPALGRNFRLLWSAAVTSRFGDALRTPALALLAATLTRDPRAIAAVTVAGQLPPLLFGLPGGAYADRWDRRRTMATVDGVRALVVAALAVLVGTGRATVPALAAVAFLLAALGTLFDAAYFAMLPAVVPPAALPGANARLQAGTAVAGAFLGAPLAGVLFALATAVPFTIDALTFALAALLVLTLPPVPPPAPARRSCTFGPDKTPESGQTAGPICKIDEAGARGVDGTRGGGRAGAGARAGVRTVWGEAWEGVRWVRGDRVLWAVTLAGAGANLAISGLMAILVLYALTVLRVPAEAYGLFAAGVVVGGLAGALVAGRLAGRFGTLPALRGVLLWQTVALTGFALARQPLTGGLALAAFAAGTTIWNSLRSAYGQRHVPAGLLGRVGAAQQVVGVATAPVGAVLAGFAGRAYGVAPVGWAAAAIFALVTAVGWGRLRDAGPVAEHPTEATVRSWAGTGQHRRARS